jgi:hypothetical protein
LNHYNAEHPEMDEPELTEELIEELETRRAERDEVLGFSVQPVEQSPDKEIVIVSSLAMMEHEHSWSPHREGPEGKVDKCECGATRVRGAREPFNG